MKECPKCKVKYNTSRVSCPLCHTVLQETNNEVSYQEYPKYTPEKETSKLILKICIFITILAIISTTVVNLLTINPDNPHYWFLIVLGGLLFLWVLVGVTIISSNNILLKIILQSITIGILLYTIELNTNIGKYVSLVYIVPFIIIGVLFCSTILTLAMPRKRESYILYLIFVSIIGVIPFIIVAVKGIKPLWPSFACFCYSLVTIFGILFFGYKLLKHVLNKKMHI